MNKYVFPGADASLPLGWVIESVSPVLSYRKVSDVQLESANFEIKSVDVLGVHYSATLHRWYLNWVSNKEKVVAKYGIRWYRVWVYFLAYSVM
jgi:cyclopropane fatty-acyl-phospholipid synthase-like methyltransferase